MSALSENDLNYRHLKEISTLGDILAAVPDLSRELKDVKLFSQPSSPQALFHLYTLVRGWLQTTPMMGGRDLADKVRAAEVDSFSFGAPTHSVAMKNLLQRLKDDEHGSIDVEQFFGRVQFRPDPDELSLSFSLMPSWNGAYRGDRDVPFPIQPYDDFRNRSRDAAGLFAAALLSASLQGREPFAVHKFEDVPILTSPNLVASAREWGGLAGVAVMPQFTSREGYLYADLHPVAVISK